MTPLEHQHALAAMAQDVRHGCLDAVGPLADLLSDAGDPRGPRLRARWRRWLLARQRAEVDQAAAEGRMEGQWSALAQRVFDVGGSKLLCQWASDRIESIDLSLQDYVELLLKEKTR